MGGGEKSWCDGFGGIGKSVIGVASAFVPEGTNAISQSLSPSYTTGSGSMLEFAP
jgi:hypothetical protein